MKKLTVLFVLLTVLLVSCNDMGGMTDNSAFWADIYYRSENETIDSEPFAVAFDQNLKTMITDAILQMSEKPVANELKPALPRNTKVVKLSIKGGRAELELSEEYLTLSEVDKTIANTCLIKTISNFIKIDELDVMVNGLMQASHFTDDSTILKAPEVYLGSDEVEIYLYNRNGELTKAKINIERKHGTRPERVAADVLISGNAGYTSPIPQGCKINFISVSAGLCTIDFSSELLVCSESKAEEMVKAIVLTQTSVDYIDRVKITVNGESVRGFEKISLKQEFGRENFLKDE